MKVNDKEVCRRRTARLYSISANDGKLIKTVDIQAKGAGSLSVFADDLSHGIYSYTLVIDGKIIDTKKRIKE